MENTINKRKYKVPQDIFMEVLRILFRNNISYAITGIKEKENSLFLTVHYSGSKIQGQAQDNIENILEEYCEYMKGIISDATLCMDDQEEDDN